MPNYGGSGFRLPDEHQMSAFFYVTVGGVDVTNAVNYSGCTIQDSEDRIRTLDFTLANAYFWMNRISRGMAVYFYGGSKDDKNRKAFFSGKVKQVHVSFPPTGSAELTVTAWGNSYRGAKNSISCTYPHKQSAREWASKNRDGSLRTEITLKEIVENICRESFYDLAVEIDIPENENEKFTLKNSIVQNCSDWMFLRLLAKRCNCTLAEVENYNQQGQHKIIFVSKNNYGEVKGESVKVGTSPISFWYAERSTKGHIKPGLLLPGGNRLPGHFESFDKNDEFGNTTGTQQFVNPKEGSIFLESLELQQNLDNSTGSLRVVSDFDEKNGGTSKLFLQEYRDETPDKEAHFMNFELKPQSDPIWKSDAERRMWNMLTSQNWDTIDMKEVRKFFNEVPTVAMGYEKTDAGMQGAGPLATIGYEVTATILGSIYIHPYRWYPIYGIGKFSSRNGGRKYYLRGMTHSFNTEGFIQTLQFMR